MRYYKHFTIKKSFNIFQKIFSVSHSLIFYGNLFEKLKLNTFWSCKFNVILSITLPDVYLLNVTTQDMRMFTQKVELQSSNIKSEQVFFWSKNDSGDSNNSKINYIATQNKNKLLTQISDHSRFVWFYHVMIFHNLKEKLLFWTVYELHTLMTQTNSMNI